MLTSAARKLYYAKALRKKIKAVLTTLVTAFSEHCLSIAVSTIGSNLELFYHESSIVFSFIRNHVYDYAHCTIFNFLVIFD